MKNKKLDKKIVFIINLEPYSQECIVVCNGNFSDAIKELKKHKSDNAIITLKHIEENKDKYTDDHHKTKSGHACLYTELPSGYVMIIDHLNSWVDTVGLIVHESLHLTHYVLHRAGIELTKESEEAYTYLLEETVEKICAKIY